MSSSAESFWVLNIPWNIQLGLDLRSTRVLGFESCILRLSMAGHCFRVHMCILIQAGVYRQWER